jgi:hypothetical protein
MLNNDKHSDEETKKRLSEEEIHDIDLEEDEEERKEETLSERKQDSNMDMSEYHLSDSKDQIQSK